MSTIPDAEEHDCVDVDLVQPMGLEGSDEDISLLEAIQHEVLMRNISGFVS